MFTFFPNLSKTGRQRLADLRILYYLQNRSLGRYGLQAIEIAGDRLSLLGVAFIEIISVPIRFRDHGEIGDREEAGKALGFAEFMDGPPVAVGYATKYRKYRIGVVVRSQLPGPAFRRPLQLPDVQGRGTKCKLHIYRRTIAEFYEVIKHSHLLVFLGNERLQRQQQCLAIFLADIVGNDGSKFELLAAGSR